MSQKLQRIFGIFFYALVAIFVLGYALSLDWGTFEGLEVNFLWLMLATIVGLGTRFLFARIWLFFLSQSGGVAKDLRSELYLVYAKSWLGRYIPGSITWVVGKVVFASKLGISKSRLAVSSFFEAVLQLLTVLLTACVLLLLDARATALFGNWTWAMVVVSAVGVVLVLPPIFKRWAALAYRVIRKATLDESLVLRGKALGLGFGLFTISSLLSGLALYFVALAVSPNLGWADLLFILASANLASAISMVAVFAPAGIGVREVVQIATLTVVMPVQQAVVVALAMRLMSLLWDFAFPILARIRAAVR